MKGLEVVGVQVENNPVSDLEGVMRNNEKAGEFIKRHLEAGRKQKEVIFLLPELSSCGYGPASFENLSIIAEDPYDGPSSRFYCSMSLLHSCYIAFGLVARDLSSPDLFNIAHVVTGPEGTVVGVFRKRHICQLLDCHEKRYFTRGPPDITRKDLIEIGGVRAVLIICYDFRFPEYLRALTINLQPHLVLLPGGWPRDQSFSSRLPFIITRAMENQVFVMSTNFSSEYNGETVFVPPCNEKIDWEGDLLGLSEEKAEDREEIEKRVTTLRSLGTEEGTLSGIVSLEYIHHIRSFFTLLTDRLPEYRFVEDAL